MATKLNESTRQKILKIARATVQAHGYSGLSFRELAKEVGIKSASVHYYFPTKGDLGEVLAQQYTTEFSEYLQSLLAQSLDPDECIKKYIAVFRNTLLNENRMCMVAFMSAEDTTLPEEVRQEVFKFSQMNVDWLTKVLTLKNDPQKNAASIEAQAFAIFAAIEGAQLVARGRRDVAGYDKIIDGYRTAGLIP